VSVSVPFEALRGDERFASDSLRITGSDVDSFAELTGDRHPQHTDEVWAADSPFGERIAHGLLILSTAVGLLPLDPERVIALRRLRDVVFKRPVRLGDSIHVEGRVVGLQPLGEEAGLVTCQCAVRNQESELVVRAAVDVIWRRDTPRAG
jgi:3-hydroxybutyryl-CoA dehydratase